MLEGLVSNLLNRFLGMYVQNFDPKQLNVGIWSGDVKLRDLELRREALDQLHLPLNVVAGHLGSLTLSIPWSNLRGKPLKINIEDVFLLAAPKEDAGYDVDEEERRAHAVKMEKLDSAELLKERNTEGMSDEEQQKNQSFTASLVTAIVDNVQVTVKNIHIRYEDSIADPGHPFALGVTLADFSAVSTDENWKPTFIQGNAASTHKLATLGSLAVYWDTDSKLIGTGKGSDTRDEQHIDQNEFIEKVKGMIVRGDNPELGDHQYILKPISGRAGLEMDKSGKIDRPKMKARLLFDELGFIIDEDQYRDALMLVDLFHYFIRHQEYKKFQPKSSPKEDPAGWLKFAGQAVLDKIHDKNRKWSWAYFAERRDDRLRYIELFKKKKRDEKPTPDEAKDLDQLERKLTYEDLRFWRSLARNELRKENVGVKKPPPKQTWSSWVWGAKKEEQHDDETQMSEQQRKELYDAISWDEKQAITEAVDMPREYVKMEVNMSLRTGSFTLKRDPHGASKEILRLLFDSFSTQFLQRTDSMFVKVALEGMRLYDGTTEGSLFPQIITIKDAPPVPDEQRFEELNDDETSKNDAKEDDEEEKEDPFFQLSFENNPLDGSADTALTMKLKGMEFVYNPRFVVEVAKFFKPPERHMESIGALMETAGATIEGIRQQTRAGLEFALTEHKTINAQLDLQAPLIIIPDSVTKKSSNCLILDAGHVSVTSELVDKDTLRDIQAKQQHQYTDEDFRKLENLMYDKFNLKLQSTQVLIGPSIEETRAQLEENTSSRDFHIVDRINMDFKIEICIVPKASDLTKFRVSGNLPILHASISDAKYKNLMKLIDVAIPKFDDDAPSKQVIEGAKGPSNLKPTSEAKTDKDPLGRDRSKSFQFSAQEHELVMEEEGEGDGNEEFEDAPAAKDAAKEAHIHQRNFEFKFTVDKLQGSLYRTDPEGKKADQLLVELIAEHFDLDFYQEPLQMGADVSLRSLAVEDHVEENPIPEFRNIISSEDVSANEQKDLFNLKFVKVNKDSPEFQTKYEGIATNLDVDVSTINLIVTRRTLLTLLDFVLITFTNPDQPDSQQAQIAAKSDEQQEATPQPQADTDKIRIRAELKRIAVVLNNDGIRLATLSLDSGDVGIFLNGKTMRIGGRLGNLSLIDDVNQGVSEESPLRQLVTIEGKSLADFCYETFDPELESYPGYDASVELKTGSIKINFLTEPFRKIMEFAVKFGKMQAIFNAARQAAANQATQIQERASKFHFDITISTPIVVFPRMVISDKPDRDTLTANLGEIYAKNTFVSLDKSKDAEFANKISAGIRNIKLTSNLHYDEDRSEELQLIDKVDLDFNITMVEHKAGREQPDLGIDGSMSNINLCLSPEQMKFALELSRTIPQAFATEPDEVVEENVQSELPDATTTPALQIRDKPVADDSPKDITSSQGPELTTDNDKWTKLDLVFKVGSIALELVNTNNGEPVGDIEAASLSKFSLNDTNVKVRMISDGSMEAELVVQSFTIRDSRTQGTNKFRKIMSLINNDVKQQFMASVSISGGKERNLIALLTIDSPRIILALDYLFALQAFVNTGLATDEPLAIEEEAENEETDSDDEIMSPDGSRTLEKPPAPAESTDAPMNISYRVNLVDAQVVLIANPAMATSEAIVLGTKQVLVSKQQAMTLQVDKIGMFLCRMDRFDTNRLRILDDFSIQTALDMRNQGSKNSLMSITVDIEPLVLRLSLRDILLAMQIVNRASAMSAGDDKKLAPGEAQSLKPPTPSKKPKSMAGKAPSTRPRTKSIATTKRSSQPAAQSSGPPATSAVLKREELHLSIEGIRVVLIGDVHEMPMLDWRVKKFGVDVRDWSGAMVADTSVDTLINVYNFSKSAWEPLIEPWSVGFHMAKDQNPDRISVDLYSRKSMELTVTAATIALGSKSFDFLAGEEDILSKPRSSDAPYRIRNHTGFSLDVWAEGKEVDGFSAKLEDGEEQPWRFEDPMSTRETLSTDGESGMVGVRLGGSGFDTLSRIPVHREGEFLYNLKPKQDRIQHRILVDVKLGADNIKSITFRSPLLVENNTQIPIELGMFSPEDGHLLKIDKIAPGDARPAPIGSVYMHSIVVRPDQGFGYAWSNERLFWKDLLKRPTRTITCRGESDDQAPPFYFQLHAAYDKKDPLTGVYPYMRLRLQAPVEVHNLLPYDFKYRIYDSNTKKDWTNFLRKGGISPVHVVELSHLLLVSVEMQDGPFKPSKFGIINSTDRESFRREKVLEVKDDNGQILHLNMHF
jgi:vacuolar protein sorting-associated protein 13A/C